MAALVCVFAPTSQLLRVSTFLFAYHGAACHMHAKRIVTLTIASRDSQFSSAIVVAGSPRLYLHASKQILKRS
jgi:hypothetical protein